VTGGAGYVGTALTAALAARDDVAEVVVYDNLSRPNPALFLSERLPSNRIRFVWADVLDTRRMRAELDGIDVVYHLAARVSTPFADADVHGLEQVNHWGTAELGYLLEERPQTRCVYLSSTSVYGARSEPATADTAPHPRTSYGISKLRGERALERLGERLRVVRGGNVYGYNKAMRFDAVVNRFMLQAHIGRPLEVHGTGQQARAFIHIDSLVRVLLAAGQEGALPGVCNAVERNVTVNDLTGVIRELYPELELRYIQQDTRLRNLVVEPEPRLGPWLDGRSLGDQLREFRSRFAFEPLR